MTHPNTLHTLFHPPPPPAPPPLPSPSSYVVAKAGDKYVARYADVEMQIEWGSALAQHQLDLVDTSRGQQVCLFFVPHPEATLTLVVSHGNALDAGGGGRWGPMYQYTCCDHSPHSIIIVVHACGFDLRKKRLRCDFHWRFCHMHMVAFASVGAVRVLRERKRRSCAFSNRGDCRLLKKKLTSKRRCGVDA